MIKNKYKKMADDNLWLAVANKKEAVEYGEAINRVLKMHFDDSGFCGECELKEYPCPTVRTLVGN